MLRIFDDELRNLTPKIVHDWGVKQYYSLTNHTNYDRLKM